MSERPRGPTAQEQFDRSWVPKALEAINVVGDVVNWFDGAIVPENPQKLVADFRALAHSLLRRLDETVGPAEDSDAVPSQEAGQTTHRVDPRDGQPWTRERADSFAVAISAGLAQSESDHDVIVGATNQGYVGGVPTESPVMPTGLHERFGLMIRVNRARGYELESWQFTTALSTTPWHDLPDQELTVQPTTHCVDSIVAVFRRRTSPAPSDAAQFSARLAARLAIQLAIDVVSRSLTVHDAASVLHDEREKILADVFRPTVLDQEPKAPAGGS